MFYEDKEVNKRVKQAQTSWKCIIYSVVIDAMSMIDVSLPIINRPALTRLSASSEAKSQK